jgi:hypothetical protein
MKISFLNKFFSSPKIIISTQSLFFIFISLNF